MADRSTNIIVAVVVLGLAGLFWWGSKQGPKYDWQERYRETKAQPYDLDIAQRLLAGYFPGKNFEEIKKRLAVALPDSGAGKSYVLIGEAMLFDSLDTGRLLRFVETGGTAFLSTKTLPVEITRALLPDFCQESMASVPDYVANHWGAARLNFLDKTLKVNDLEPFDFAYQNEPRGYQWAVIDSAMACPGDFSQTDLGTLDDTLVNFVEWRHGSGRFLLHTCPVAFCNYFLLKKSGRGYAAGAFSHLAESDLFWDSKNRTTEDVGRRRNQKKGGPDAPPGESPLAYILQQPPLAWAWYLMLAMVGAFVVFRGKRRQRVIPVLKKPENTTLDFVKTIGQLSFRQQNREQLCQQNMRLFLAFLRERYGLASARPDAAFFRQIALTAQVPEAEVEAIFSNWHTVESGLGDEKTMLALYRGIERFQQICR